MNPSYSVTGTSQDAILRAPIHIIATLRSKTEYVLQDVGGKTVPRKVGMAPVQRDGFEYEFTTVLELSLDGHLASVSKDRTGLFDGRDPAPLLPETGRMLLEWLSSGAPPRAQNRREATAKASQRPLEAFLRRRQSGKLRTAKKRQKAF